MSKADKKALAKHKPASKRKKKQGKLAAQPDKKNAVAALPEGLLQNPLYRPIKKQVTLRLDADVIAWLRKNGKGYQTKANALLRELMVREIT